MNTEKIMNYKSTNECTDDNFIASTRNIKLNSNQLACNDNSFNFLRPINWFSIYSGSGCVILSISATNTSQRGIICRALRSLYNFNANIAAILSKYYNSSIAVLFLLLMYMQRFKRGYVR